MTVAGFRGGSACHLGDARTELRAQGLWASAKTWRTLRSVSAWGRFNTQEEVDYVTGRRD